MQRKPEEFVEMAERLIEKLGDIELSVAEEDQLEAAVIDANRLLHFHTDFMSGKLEHYPSTVKRLAWVLAMHVAGQERCRLVCEHWNDAHSPQVFRINLSSRYICCPSCELGIGILALLKVTLDEQVCDICDETVPRLTPFHATAGPFLYNGAVCDDCMRFSEEA